MKKGRKVLCLMLAFCMLCSLAACGKKEETSAGLAEKNSKDYVYSQEEISLHLEGVDFSDFWVCNDKIYAYGTNYTYPEADGMMEMDTDAALSSKIAPEEEVVEEVVEEEVVEPATEEVDDFFEPMSLATVKLVVGEFQLDGTNISTFEKTFNGDCGIQAITSDSQGNIYFILNEYGKDTSNPDNIKDAYTLYCCNSKGEDNWNVVLGENVKTEDYYYVNQIAVDHDDNLIIKSSLGIEVYGKDSKKINDIKLDEVKDAGNLLILRDNSVAMFVYGESKMGLHKINISTGSLTKGQDFPFNSYNYSYFAGKTSDLILINNSGIYFYNDGDAEVTKAMDFVDSDIMTTNLYSIQQIDDKSFIGSYYDEETYEVKCAKFTKVNPADIKDKVVLTLGCNYLDSDVRKQVIDYNKQNSDYRIKVVDYSIYNTEEDYMIAQTKLNTDIISGNMPDILLLNSDMPVESYVSKKLFADMNPFLEADPELKKEDYLQNVFEALSRDGKLYQISPSFYIFTVLGKASEVGEKSGWTFEDLQKLMKSKGPDVVSFNEITKQNVLDFSMWFCNSQFINWQTGECKFNSEAFIKTLEFANEFPKEIKYPEEVDESYWESYQTMYREGRALLMLYTISNFEDYNNCEKGTFGEKITPIGFPSENKNGSALNFNLDFAISAKSKNQDAAWEFVRCFLTDDYQNKIEYGFPIKLSSLEEKAKKAQQRPFYLDENGAKVEYDNTYYLNGVDVVIDPMTQQETDYVMDYIKSITQVMNYNTSITDIVVEESAAYFDNQKTPQEVADIIQSRVQIYVNENR